MNKINLFTFILSLFIISTSNNSLYAQTFTEATNFPVEGLSYSSLDWGDYDNDGDLDLLISGRVSTQNYITKIYTNDGNGSFTELTTAQLPGVYLGTVNWGDFNNDNLLDIFITGNTDGGEGLISKIFLNNGDGTFTESTQSVFKGVNISSVDLGDYDNDGYLDVILSGNYGNTSTTKIYRNNGDMTFTELQSANIVDVFSGQVSWGDYDNDGDLDILITGRSLSESYVAKIYTNNGDGTFSELTGLPFPKEGWSSSAWGDYNNDGYLDVLMTGYSPGIGRNTRLFTNNGDGSFTQSTNEFTGISEGSIAFGDYNNDGKLDILYAGSIGSAPPISRVYTNNDNNEFTELTGNNLINTKYGSVAWADVDNDGDLDLIISGQVTESQSVTKLYINNTSTPNTPPNPLTNLSANVENNDIVFTWDKGTDSNQTDGLSYNLYLKKKDATNSFVRSPYSLVETGANNGKRTIQQIGDIQGKRNSDGTISYTLKNAYQGGAYEWSVQAVDASLSGGAFTAPQVLSTFDFTYENKNISIYPVPAENEINIKSLNTIESAEILNIKGQVLRNYKGDINKINVSNLAKGIYFIRIKTLDKVETIKFQKK